MKIDAEFIYHSEFRVLKCLWGCISRQATIQPDRQESYELYTFGLTMVLCAITMYCSDVSFHTY